MPSSPITLPVRAIELLASRICHDLVSPVGAVNNGVEFMEDMGPDGFEDSLDLIKHSAQQASVRLQLFRLCYGAGGSEQMVSAKAIYEGFINFMDKAKFSLEWDLLNDVPDELPNGFLKMVLNGLIFIHDGLPKGGAIMIKVDGDQMILKGTGDMVRLREGSLDAFEGKAEVDDIDPKNIHGYVTHYFSKVFEIDMAANIGEDHIQLNLSL
jgi:histidine phosphotransferase ChpT